MFWSLPIGRILGIPIRLHIASVLVVAGWIALSWPKELALGTMGRVGMLVAFILAHELGHSIAARRLGVNVVDIMLWPLGGVARLSGMPKDAKIEAKIAAAGPGVNLALALILTPFALGVGWPPGNGWITGNGVKEWVAFATLCNWAMGLLNLVPAFPLDGGRLSRSLLTHVLGWEKSTLAVIWVGRFFAIFLMLSTFFDPGRLWPLILLGIFIDRANERERGRSLVDANPEDVDKCSTQ